MYAEIHTRIAVERGPAEYDKREASTPYDKRQEYRQSKRVGGVARRKSVAAAAVAVDDVDRLAERIGEIRRTQTLEHRTQQCGAGLIGQCNRRHEHNNKDAGAQRIVFLEEKQQYQGIHRRPDEPAGEKHHETVEKGRMEAIEKQQQLRVEIDKSVKHGQLSEV